MLYAHLMSRTHSVIWQGLNMPLNMHELAHTQESIDKQDPGRLSCFIHPKVLPAKQIQQIKKYMHAWLDVLCSIRSFFLCHGLAENKDMLAQKA